MKRRALVLVSLILGPVGCAAAQGTAFDGHFYGFVNAGRADTEAGFTTTDRIDGDDTAFDLGIGYTFGPVWSVEASYQDFGKPDGFAGCPPDLLCIALVPFSRESVSVDGWAVALRGEVPVHGRWSAFARLGALAWNTSARTPGLDDSGTDVLYGLGVAGRIDDRFSVQLAYEKSGLDTDAIKLGLKIDLRP